MTANDTEIISIINRIVTSNNKSVNVIYKFVRELDTYLTKFQIRLSTTTIESILIELEAEYISCAIELKLLAKKFLLLFLGLEMYIVFSCLLGVELYPVYLQSVVVGLLVISAIGIGHSFGKQNLASNRLRVMKLLVGEREGNCYD
jgi:hypothetical protein